MGKNIISIIIGCIPLVAELSLIKNYGKGTVSLCQRCLTFFLLTTDERKVRGQAQRGIFELRLLTVMAQYTKSKLEIKSNSSLDERLGNCIIAKVYHNLS